MTGPMIHDVVALQQKYGNDTSALFKQPDAGQFDPPLQGSAAGLATEVIETVLHASRNAPRSQQVKAGPSELGTPCTRRLGYKLLDWPQVNADGDPWPSVIGTSVHAWMADAFAEENRQLGYQRYLIEHRVHLPLQISGSCDLYDRDRGAVVDWKITSPERVRKYRKEGPGQQYRTQAHLYGLGLQLAGEKPADVAICFLPRGGQIATLHLWSEPYDVKVAVSALRRYQQVFQFHVSMNPEANPQYWALLATGDAYCTFCPWFLPGSTDLSKGCPGHKQR